MDRDSSQSEVKAKKTYKCPYDKCGEVQKSLNGHKKHLGLCFFKPTGHVPVQSTQRKTLKCYGCNENL